MKHKDYEARRIAIFWSRVTKRGEDECWTWDWGTDENGYGLFHYFGETVRCPQFVMETYLGVELGKDDNVLHRCDNPPCVNPKHLFIGTIADNNADCVAKGRQARQKGSRNGRAKQSEEQALEIKRRLDAGEKAYMLAAEYKLSKQTISAIKHNKRWSHLNEDNARGSTTTA